MRSGPARTKQINVKISEDEHHYLQIVAAHVGITMSDFLRPILVAAVEREIERRGLRVVMPRRLQTVSLEEVLDTALQAQA